jgi:hypothetical protein
VMALEDWRVTVSDFLERVRLVLRALRNGRVESLDGGAPVELQPALTPEEIKAVRHILTERRKVEALRR